MKLFLIFFLWQFCRTLKWNKTDNHRKWMMSRWKYHLRPPTFSNFMVFKSYRTNLSHVPRSSKQTGEKLARKLLKLACMSVLPLASSRSSGEPRRPYLGEGSTTILKHIPSMVCLSPVDTSKSCDLFSPPSYMICTYPDTTESCTELLSAWRPVLTVSSWASPWLKAILLSLIKQIGPGRTQIHNLWASITIFFTLATLLAVEGIRNPSTSTNDTPALITPIVALITNASQLTGPDIRVADYTLAITLLTEPPDGDATLLAAHDEIWVVLSHGNPAHGSLARCAPGPAQKLGKLQVQRGMKCLCQLHACGMRGSQLSCSLINDSSRKSFESSLQFPQTACHRF